MLNSKHMHLLKQKALWPHDYHSSENQMELLNVIIKTKSTAHITVVAKMWLNVKKIQPTVKQNYREKV